MVMMAAVQALETWKRPCRVTLHTDSKYVMDGITKWVFGWQKNGWKTADRKPVKNAELWQELVRAAARHKVTWQWVKGHAGHPENEIGRASCRERVCQYVSISVVAVSLKKKHKKTGEQKSRN